MGNFDELEDALTAMVWLAMAGALALVLGAGWGIWWLFTHISLVVK